jgi:hypothetical protein
MKYYFLLCAIICCFTYSCHEPEATQKDLINVVKNTNFDESVLNNLSKYTNLEEFVILNIDHFLKFRKSKDMVHLNQASMRNDSSFKPLYPYLRYVVAADQDDPLILPKRLHFQMHKLINDIGNAGISDFTCFADSSVIITIKYDRGFNNMTIIHSLLWKKIQDENIDPTVRDSLLTGHWTYRISASRYRGW